jgi:PHS family inorganic phosphate transporter-like MFS transporter
MAAPFQNGVPAINHGFEGHVLTLDECRTAALAEIDNAPYSKFVFRVCAIAGLGFFTNAYDIFAVEIASQMLGYVVGKNGQLTTKQDLGLKAAATIGIFFGQLLFGWLGDRGGRKRIYGIEFIVMIIPTFAQALSGSGTTVNIINVLIVWRFIMGLGIGGDYPLSAVIVSEFAPISIRGRMMTAVVAAQGWGTLAASLVALVVVSAYKSTLSHQSPTDPAAVDYMWRLLIGLGCAPAVVGLYFRLTIPETPRFTMDIDRNLNQALVDIGTSLRRDGVPNDDEIIRRIAVPKASWNDFKRYFGRRDNRMALFGVAYSWFAIDAAFYGLGLNNSFFLDLIFPPADSVYQTLFNVSLGNVILAVAGLIPGYWISFLLIDSESWGRRPIQLGGFGALAVLFITLGTALDKLMGTAAGQKAIIFFYCLINFFQNFGPNTTTFIIPGEIFPTRYRATCHGIAAASGKLGATLALVIFAELKDRPKSLNNMLYILVFFMATGFLSTLFLVPETRGESLEDLSNENQQGFVRGYAHHDLQAAELPPLIFYPFEVNPQVQ